MHSPVPPLHKEDKTSRYSDEILRGIAKLYERWMGPNLPELYSPRHQSISTPVERARNHRCVLELLDGLLLCAVHGLTGRHLAALLAGPGADLRPPRSIAKVGIRFFSRDLLHGPFDPHLQLQRAPPERQRGIGIRIQILRLPRFVIGEPYETPVIARNRLDDLPSQTTRTYLSLNSLSSTKRALGLSVAHVETHIAFGSNTPPSLA